MKKDYVLNREKLTALCDWAFYQGKIKTLTEYKYKERRNERILKLPQIEHKAVKQEDGCS